MATNEQPIILKKVKKVVHGHHGGAWKIAYADFVTAMMAFFLLMWLISMTTPEQKQGLADYFAPSNVSRSTSGAGGIMGGTAFDEEGARMPGTKPQVVMTISTPAQPKSPELAEKEAKDAAQMDKLMKEKSARDEQNFRSAAESIRQAMRENPDLAELSRNVIIDETPEGLRIQIVDQDGRSMFPSGHAEPFERTRRLLDEVAAILIKLPNRVSISGHTDANPVAGRPGYSNWELTADRANATRRILENAGLSNDRIYQVVGKADSEPLFPEDPYMAANRRLSVLLLREAPVTPPGFSP
ncbi:flagellar motor protein MotB [Parvibaculum sp.]|jgi:chemotaxis protein MotB|uniref:flagellar motor protein MotB n=1 Tax=Parvibaculum sp. TaxID=2024848 RepID=UPI001B0B06DB|nr:flagellar motor protein MotB [Parvibaculum sp.]MBO6635084.1 flagellar motor protein MotB [Parvibaculum sp.]MBO6680210.1 flagellar motor protein MotB [Parvibaculum sp.]MBO6685487.1 flagellar motor protein MotB [Parvibaculum sp.]MBO6903488.1 flagellar motor protein MotB [Parvibaculum sp.]